MDSRVHKEGSHGTSRAESGGDGSPVGLEFRAGGVELSVAESTWCQLKVWGTVAVGCAGSAVGWFVQ